MMLLTAVAVQAQIVIGGSVYGGGNAGNTGGRTTVRVCAGDLNAVFGGARMANVGGSAFVNIDGKHASDNILINKVYGGNDIAGTIGTSTKAPTELEDTTENNIHYTWNAFVRVSTKMKTTGTGNEAVVEPDPDAKIFIGQLYGGGNGDYDYTSTAYSGLNSPVLAKTYLEIKGGTTAHVYGGGNAATVTNNTTIYINNPSNVVTSINDAGGTDILADPDGTRLIAMGLNTTQTHASSADFQFARVFGGNNKADMAIRPKWNLKRGAIRDLYSGGNEGRMTSPEGLLLQIESSGMTVDNVYGGCRKADVRPLYNNNDETPVPNDEIKLDPSNNPNNIPGGYAARVRVLDGHVNNVYGGNDISGNVYGGNTVGIFTHIYGNIYGGGNGSYAYTDNTQLKDDPKWRDFYYDPEKILQEEGVTDVADKLKSATALNLFRPNAEKVSILVRGTAEKPVTVDGAFYVGGNSASLRDQTTTRSGNSRQTHIKIGSYVTIDNVFLGNNGENMINSDEANVSLGKSEGVLRTLASTTLTSDESKFNSMVLTDKDVFAKYMEGCAMKVKPTVVFESIKNGDNSDYIPYSSKFGSFFCGGNVGSILVDGKITVDFEDKVIIYDKVVGGCNNANVYKTDYNAEYLGGMLGEPDPVPVGSPEGAIGDKLELNFSGLKIQPMRWKDENDKSKGLEWNTWIGDAKDNIDLATASTGETNNPNDLNRRFKGGNIYGGCYNNGHVNGNVVINLNASIVDRKGEYAVFDQVEQNEGEAILYGNNSYNITERRSGVILDEQGMDPLGKALNVFGGGYGGDSEIWGSTTINLNAGYTFQIFGGGEQGAIGKAVSHAPNATDPTIRDLTYEPNEAYSTYINLKGNDEGVYRGHADDNTDMAEAEFIYGGAFEGLIAGSTHINLGNGRIFNSFAGSCNADILGHTETYVGRQKVIAADGTFTYVDGGGFPYIRDHIYGGNDLGGNIIGTTDFTDRVDNDVKDKVHSSNVTNASAYTEYTQGRVGYIFGGCYGDYDYTDDHYRNYTYSDGKSKQGFTKPRMDNAFVNFRPNTHTRNEVKRIYGAGQGHEKGIGVDSMQNRSYVLVEIPQAITKFQNVAVFGAGANCGLGMGVAPADVEAQPDKASAIIDLVQGQIKNAYGGSYAEGVTRRTVVNVPLGATIQLDSIFGGAYGADPMYPCDVYEAQVNYQSEDARVTAIFGGNNSADRTLYGQVNVNVPVWQKNGYMGTVYGAGFGKDTWSQYTEVNLLDGAHVWEVYGGGYGGKVLNTESLVKWRHDEGAALELSLPGYEDTSRTYKDKDNGDFHLDVGLNSSLAHAVRMDGKKYNTNVHIYKGATVERYAYGGGLGADAVVSGTTYIDLLGGTVGTDLYAGGTSGAVQDYYQAKTFTASATAYIEGGTARNVYGGGWEGHVGYHDTSTTETSGDIPGETHVVIGIRKDRTAALPSDYGYYDGVPAIQRNAYSGGEGGSVFGDAYLTLNNGYIGYTYNTETGEYQEKIHDETWTDHIGKDRLSDCGNLFGGGYDDNSSVDNTHVTVWGGVVRNSVFGGGEIATIGRGKVRESDTDNKVRELEAIYKFGGTNIKIYNGHVKRNVFGGGKGYNILGYGGIHGFYTDGYVFGQTAVYIHGGEIGTDAGLAEGYGNVFGGGDVGYVYGKGFFTETSGKTSTGSPGHYYYYDSEGNLTEDCKVVVAPMLQIRGAGEDVTFGKDEDGNDIVYHPYDYVPTEYLNKLPSEKTDAGWLNLYTGDKLTDDDQTERGVHIHNAVFAGGNVSSNSESYNNATTVFGNTTATLYDAYHHDFITVGTEHTGGLYGGGNLSLVGGYRELNITNYGTDYYGLGQQISLAEYQKLTNRERAYFKLEYLCQQDYGDYQAGQRISEDEYNALPSGYKNENYWKQYGFCSIYAGRLLNTIQRADFCGVYGSRLVLQGAKDRVADVGDATEYTINRVGEVSLNQQRSVIDDDLTLKGGATQATDPNDQDPDDYEEREKAIHGNYFGIYSVVNYLGALTSDVHFQKDHYRYVDKELSKTDESHTYYTWKQEHIDKRDRNNGTSLNQVALASGVFLELTSENSTPNNKIYGDITGVVELDLINVKKDIEGGGYVYARNEHGKATHNSDLENVLLSDYNKPKIVDGKEWRDEARTRKRYTYSTSELLSWQTSGNFIHRSKRIVDDCYPNNGIYQDAKGLYVTSPAHYWYIKGEVYIYNQVVSAYAGSASAYSKEVKIPLTITAGSNGRLQLLNVQPSLYAYYADEERTSKIPTEGVKVDNESMTYHLNDVISWWDWHHLSNNEQKFFVKETRVNVDSCTIDGTPYPAGTFVLEDDATIHETTAWQTFQTETHTILDAGGNEVTNWANLFRPSNNIGHDTGYVLTLDMNSPKDWDDWYTPVNNNSELPKLRKEQYEALSDTDKEKYREGPTYTLKTGESSGLYGQREYTVGEVISQEVYDDYEKTVSLMNPRPTEGQASVEPAYVALTDFDNTQAGNAISETAYNALSASDKSHFAPAMICVNTIQTGEEEYVLLGELVSGTPEDLTALAQKYMEYNNDKINADKIEDLDEARTYIMEHLSNAWYIKSEGLYGGQYFVNGTNYSALKSWCTLSESRNKFEYNYDAFDVLVDPQYHGEGHTNTYYHSPYSDVKSVEYEAAYYGTGTLTYYDNENTSHEISANGTISRENYEKIRNDQLHYTRIQVESGSDEQTVYIVNETLINNGTPYAKGQDISEKDYKSLSAENKLKVDVVTFQKGTAKATKYYCYDAYTPASSFTPERGTAGQKGSVISETTFNDASLVPNYQKYFTIQGAEPTETTTLYVSRESNAKDVTSEKIISVVYQYTYYEADDEGEGVSMVNELHVVNIHLQLESGAPEIGPLNAPPAVLPGNTLGLKAPTVNPGLYEVLTNGWELFDNEEDAMLHRNGTPFTNNGTPLYWYQNQKVFLAFYSKTYLGKTYSNYVPLTVANYHDLDAIMKDKEHHLYVDHPDVMRNSKIYIDNRDCESDPTKSELDLLKDFFDLSVNSGSPAVAGHASLDPHVKAGADLEFILNSDISPKAYCVSGGSPTGWTPIGDATNCFEGNLHGDGYTVSGLDHSLFGNLCGSVYNLGVTGSFTSAGVVDTGDGYVENCWINTSATSGFSTKAVFGNPTDASRKQVVNCYYPNTKSYAAGDAHPMTEQEFYNGTVAFNLNGFYLNKRYYDHTVPNGSPIEYKYLKDVDGTLSETFITGYYPAAPDAQYGNVGYVERRYTDGDFIYAGGTIPESYDDRRRVVTEGTASIVKYAPIWPDDYIYFGQTLTYDYNSSRPHNDEPTHVVKNSGRLPVSNTSNRVYRAPAYYQSKDMSYAHFNLWANLAAYSMPQSPTDDQMKPAYPDMTAIDFAGHNDNTWALGTVSSGSSAGTKWFYPPLLDDDEGLLSIENNYETPNLLVYAPEKGNEKTDNALAECFAEPTYADYYSNDKYRQVSSAPTSSIHGHLIQSDLKATNDQLLVDKRDFNCPISYTFADGYRMWYQRMPDRYVDTSKGWETISVPFTAELVTTQDKGEITHFYSGSRSVNENGTKVGHEYWLREYKGKKSSSGDTFVAAFNYPTAGGSDKDVENTFLWDYYYSKNNQQDANTDAYQIYYKTYRQLAAYPLLAAARPYIVGFPGKTYYEFDLSGEWTPKHTAEPAPEKLNKQLITFVSYPSNEDEFPVLTVGISDDEPGTANDGYTFKTNYMSKAVTGYLLNADGNSFTATTAATVAVPFRPYFVASGGSNPGSRGIQRINFDNVESSFAIGDNDPSEGEVGEGVLLFSVGKRKISVTSSLHRSADVHIVNIGGLTIASFNIQPGETVDTNIGVAGVYIIHAAGGRYQKKIAIK